MKESRDSWGALIAVVALHAGVAALALWPSSPETRELDLPVVQGIILPAPPAEVVQTPSTKKAPVKPAPAPEKPIPKPEKVIPPQKPRPIIEPPSERAITREQPEPVEADPPESTALPETPDNSLGAPVTPPHEDARVFNNPRPGYPKQSRRMREQGTVILEVLILPDGTVGDVRVKQSSGFKRLDATAIKAVKRWKYVPARRGEEPIEYWYLQPLEFSLR